MKHLLRFSALLALIAALSWTPGGLAVHAEKPPISVQAYASSWVTSFQVQNQGSATANIVIDYYKADGSVALSVPDTIPAGGSKLYYQGNVAGLPNGQYSVVISSDQPVVAITNQEAQGPYMTGAYSGFVGGLDTSTTFYLPTILKNYYASYTAFTVQNAGTGDALVTMTYYDRTGNVAKTVANQTIKAGAAQTYDQMGMSDLPDGFLGSVKITSNQPVAAIVNNFNNTPGRQTVATYNGFADGATTMYLPVVENNYYGWVTSIMVQNVDTAAANVTLTFSNGLTKSDTIQPNTSKLWYQPNDGLPNGFIGGCTVTSTNGKKIAAVASLASIDPATTGAASYIGFSAGSTSISLPVLMSKYYGWVTSYTIQNVDNSDANVTITYTNTGIPAKTATIGPNASKVYYQPNDGVADGYLGSATITSTNGKKIVAVVNELRIDGTAGDGTMSYNGIAK